jgi:hypothetical protein
VTFKLLPGGQAKLLLELRMDVQSWIAGERSLHASKDMKMCRTLCAMHEGQR